MKKVFKCVSETTTDDGQSATFTENDSNESFSMPELVLDVPKGTFEEGKYYAMSIDVTDAPASTEVQR